MQGLPKNVWVLTVAQALNMSAAPMVVLIGGIIGSSLAPTAALATLPVALMVVGTALSTVLVTIASARWGRKHVFYGGMLVSAIGALLCAFSLSQTLFVGFSLGTLLLGASLAVVQQYRFAAMESVDVEMVPRAASRILLAGLVSAFVGPELAVRGRDLLDAPYAAAFLGLIGLNSMAALVMAAYQPATTAQHQQGAKPQAWDILLRRPVLWVAILGATVGYTVMSFVMTATPLSMHAHAGHDLVETKQVIQSHIVAMYLPSLFSGWLISQFGIGRMMFVGCLLLLGAVAVALAGIDLGHYWVSLVLLGVGWNFLFVGGTALLPQAYEGEEPFRAQAVNEFMVFGCQAVAALSAGWVLSLLGWTTLLYWCIPLIGLQLFMLLFWRLR